MAGRIRHLAERTQKTYLRNRMAKRKSSPASSFLGRFRIMAMDQWDQDFVDEEVEGFFEFKKYGLG
jgi:hypothetical protein